MVKSQADGADKYGRNALLGLHKALRSIARKKAAADADANVAADVIAATEDPHEVARREARLRIACVLGHSVNHLHVCAPMAAWSLVYGSRFLTSEAFSVANLNEAMSWVNGGDLAYSLAHLADTGGADADILTPSCDTDDYAWRGKVLADLSLYEFSMLYKLSSVAASTPVAAGAAIVIPRCPRTGRVLETLMPQHVELSPQHPRSHTHVLTRYPFARTPEVYTARLACQYDLHAIGPDDPAAVDGMLRYLVLYHPWRGAVTATTLPTGASPDAVARLPRVRGCTSVFCSSEIKICGDVHGIRVQRHHHSAGLPPHARWRRRRALHCRHRLCR